MSEDRNQAEPTRGDATDGGSGVHFEETLSMSDRKGVRSLVTGTRVLVLLLGLGFVAVVGLIVGGRALMLVSAAGGIDTMLSVVTGVLSERPLLLGVVLLVGLVTVAGSLVTAVAMGRRLGQVFEQTVHVRVTETGVVVRREESHANQSRGVDVPFDAITAVEYLDPDESSTRLELGDLRAPKFFAGRSRSWIRIEREGDPAVYVGSDRPEELAVTVAQRSPHVEHATVY